MELYVYVMVQIVLQIALQIALRCAPHNASAIAKMLQLVPGVFKV